VSEPKSGPLVDPADVPDWMRKLLLGTADLDEEMFRRLSPPEDVELREAAVLILLGESEQDGRPDVLLQLRADGTGAHAGQVAFPGGSWEPGDDGPIDTALREAEEETGLLPSGVRPVALLPPLLVPVSGFRVTPVLAHWDTPSPVHAVDPAESAAVARVPIATLADPANRFQVGHPSGFVGPAFAVPGMLVWGFTAGLMTVLLSIGGWERPWDTDDVRDLDVAWRSIGPFGAEAEV
jgi:8-oxo-dGTP pyrophosphatase MutT (NUDIX family)